MHVYRAHTHSLTQKENNSKICIYIYIADSCCESSIYLKHFLIYFASHFLTVFLSLSLVGYVQHIAYTIYDICVEQPAPRKISLHAVSVFHLVNCTICCQHHHTTLLLLHKLYDFSPFSLYAFCVYMYKIYYFEIFVCAN